MTNVQRGVVTNFRNLKINFFRIPKQLTMQTHINMFDINVQFVFFYLLQIYEKFA